MNLLASGGADHLAIHADFELQPFEQDDDLLLGQLDPQPAAHIRAGDLDGRVERWGRVVIHQAPGGHAAGPLAHQFQTAGDAAFRHGGVYAAREAVSRLGGQALGEHRAAGVDIVPGGAFQ